MADARREGGSERPIREAERRDDEEASNHLPPATVAATLKQSNDSQAAILSNRGSLPHQSGSSLNSQAAGLPFRQQSPLLSRLVVS